MTEIADNLVPSRATLVLDSELANSNLLETDVLARSEPESYGHTADPSAAFDTDSSGDLSEPTNRD